jgi:phosphohistidine phosphatase
MKELLIIRHAKSSWGNLMDPDFERTLNERGHRDAPEMAQRVKNRGVAIQQFISSTATRALSTATYFAEAYGLKASDIILYPSLYHAPKETFFDVIADIPDEITTVAIFSHNPGITDFVNSLCETRIDDMPTCGIFAIRTESKNWQSFTEGQHSFWFFDYPKL